MPKGYVPLSKDPIQGKVHLVSETKEIPVERVPVAGAFYHFFNNDSGLYFSADASADAHGVASAPQAHTIFYYADNALLSYERGMYINGPGLSTAATSPVILEPSMRGTLDMCNIISNNTEYICLSNDLEAYNTLGTSSDAASNASYDFANRMVLSLPVAIPESGWTTFSATVATTVPEGCVAYVADAYDASTASVGMSAVLPGTTIAANPGIVLKAAPATPVGMVITEAGCEYFANMLRPSVVAAPVAHEHKAYALVDDNGMISFRLLSAAERTLPAHSSWLLINDDNAPENLSVAFPGEETGITAVGAQVSGNGVIYNIHGQIIKKPQPGINIINGKKTIMR